MRDGLRGQLLSFPYFGPVLSSRGVLLVYKEGILKIRVAESRIARVAESAVFT